MSEPLTPKRQRLILLDEHRADADADAASVASLPLSDISSAVSVTDDSLSKRRKKMNLSILSTACKIIINIISILIIIILFLYIILLYYYITILFIIYYVTYSVDLF